MNRETQTQDNPQEAKAHTPTPWYWRKWDDGVITVDHDASAVATIHHADEEAHANARLIAAAPELLEALEELTEGLGPLELKSGYWTRAIENAIAAIARAKGESDA